MLEDSSGMNTNTNRGKGPFFLCAVNRNIGFFFLSYVQALLLQPVGSDGIAQILYYLMALPTGVGINRSAQWRN